MNQFIAKSVETILLLLLLFLPENRLSVRMRTVWLRKNPLESGGGYFGPADSEGGGGQDLLLLLVT